MIYKNEFNSDFCVVLFLRDKVGFVLNENMNHSKNICKVWNMSAFKELTDENNEKKG